MKQTAVEWLQQALEDTILTHEQIMQTVGLFEQAKEMEQEQIKDAYKQGTCHHGDGYTATEYYEDTFVNNEK
jgi:hypothetical protein